MPRRTLLIGFVLFIALSGIAIVAGMRHLLKPDTGNAAGRRRAYEALVGHQAQTGDLIFQTAFTNARAHDDIIKMINGKWNHCGILFRQGDSFSVFGIAPYGNAGFSSLDSWLGMFHSNDLIVKRLPAAKWPGHTTDTARLRAACNRYIGYHFNYDFDSTAGKAYPAGLVRAVMGDAAGLQLGVPVLYRNFACGYTYSKTMHRECSTGNADLRIITPEAILAAPELQPVYATPGE